MLRSIARHYINQDISDYCFVFPNRRAGLFFDKYIQQEATHTMIAPEILTIADLFQSYSNSKLADQLTLLFELYRAYIKVLEKNGREKEPLSDFIPFGQILIADFNDIDNYQVDARRIFENISDLQALSSDSYLTENQKKALERLFIYKGVDKIEYRHRENFKSVWSMLFDVYTEFKKALNAKGLAYSGMQCRDVVESMQGGIDTPYSKVIFVGFNALNEVERSLFKALGTKADFYWDYDLPLVNDSDNLASRFAADNIRLFPSKEQVSMLPLPSETKYTHIITSSMTAQAIEAKKLLNRLNANNISTAIVLLDEKMLLPVLMSLPIHDTERYQINVTMGFPISHTPVLKFIEALLLLQHGAEDNGTFYHKHVNTLLTHPYIITTCAAEAKRIQGEMLSHNTVRVEAALFQTSEAELLKKIFNTYPDDELLSIVIEILGIVEPENEYDGECLSQVLLALNNMNALLKEYDYTFKPLTLLQIVRQSLSRISVSFKGEPLNGLQIMGTLETRCLSFENIILLSFNEGVFPKNESQNSYIPYNLRSAFGMPTTEHQDAVYAYNFYRLIARAKNVYMISDCRTDNMKNGEPSRYLNQLRYIYNKEVETVIASCNTTVGGESVEISKPSDWLDKFRTKELRLSASSIKTYLGCGVKFYIEKYLKIREKDEITEIMESNQLGSVFHKAIETLYTQLKTDLCGQPFTKDALMQLHGNLLRIETAVTDAMRSEYFNGAEKFEITGINRIMYDLIVRYIKKVIEVDAEKAPFTLEGCEQGFIIPYTVRDERFKDLQVTIKGFIDRVDTYFDSNNTKRTRLIDYKTGSVKVNLGEKKTDFKSPKNETTRQLMLYRYYKEKNVAGSTIDLDAYGLAQLYTDPDATTGISYTEEHYAQFCEVLDAIITEIIDPDVTLKKVPESRKQTDCKYCDFTSICSRLK